MAPESREKAVAFVNGYGRAWESWDVAAFVNSREVAGQVYFTDGGLLVEHGPPKQFFASPKDPRTRQFLDQIL